MKKGKLLFLAMIIAVFTLCQVAFGQSTILNAPSTDVVAEKGFYFEAGFASHLRSYSNSGFQTYGLRGVYGIKKNLEIGANFVVTRNSTGTPTEFQPNIKWKAYSNEKRGVAVSGGTVLFVPLNKIAGSRTTAMVYANASKTVKATNGTRLTGGAYTVLNTKGEAGTKTGAILSAEQPVHKKLNLSVEWFSGKNRFGYASAGFSWFVTKKQTVYAGYNFGNTGRGNNSLFVFYGYTF